MKTKNLIALVGATILAFVLVFGGIWYAKKSPTSKHSISATPTKFTQDGPLPGDNMKWAGLDMKLPTTSETAWEPELTTNRIRKAESDARISRDKEDKARAEESVKTWKKERERMAAVLADMPPTLIARMHTIADKLRDYPLETIEKNVPDVFKLIEVDLTLYEPDVLFKRLKEYAGKVGESELRNKSTKLAGFLEFGKKRGW